jgi:hypothetical protein
MEHLTSWAWVDNDGALHLEIPALLQEMNVRDTPENREKASALAETMLRDLMPGTPCAIVRKEYADD